MRSVGIKALKANLSEYVRLAKKGETILVTDRDHVVAELRPAHREPGAVTLEARLDALADRGEVTLRSEELSSWPGFSSRVRLPAGMDSRQLLEALREDSE